MRFLFTAVLALTVLPSASAQVTTSPVPLGEPTDSGLSVALLTEMTTAYNSGDWTTLQTDAKAVLDAAQVDYTTNFAIVTWIAADPLGKASVPRVVVHDPSTGEPFSPDLPGVGAGGDRPPVLEVFLSRRSGGRIASAYTSTRDKDPLADQLPVFAEALATALFQSAGAFAGTIGGPFAAAAPTIIVSVARVSLPFARATIKWKASAKEPTTVAAFTEAADAFARDLEFAQPSGSACARSAIQPLRNTIVQAANDSPCAGPAATGASCVPHFDAAIGAAVRDARAGADCAKAPRDDLSDLEQVEKKTREFVRSTLTAAADAEVTFKNRPLTHWSLGAGTGLLFGGALTLPRVAVKNEAIVADPLGRVVTLSFANWSPAGYDAEREPLRAAERVRGIFGVTITPDFGGAAGINVLLARGIGVMAAGVVMFAKGADAVDIGAAPRDPNVPFRISYARGWIVGASYNFK